MQHPNETANVSGISRMSTVLKMFEISESTIRRKIKAGTFPKPCRIGVRSIGFLNSSLADYEKSLAAQSADEV